MTITPQLPPNVGRPPPPLSYTPLVPNAPQDITVDQVRAYLAGHPEVRTVVISISWLKSQRMVAPWYDLAPEIESRGGALHFANGVAPWEAWFASTTASQGRASVAIGQIPAPGIPLEGVTADPPATDTQAAEPDPVLHLVDPDEELARELQEDAHLGAHDADDEFCAGAPTQPDQDEFTYQDRGEQTPTPAESKQGDALSGAVLEQHIRELAVQSPELGYRKIAAALTAEGFQVSHMKVSRVLRR